MLSAVLSFKNVFILKRLFGPDMAQAINYIPLTAESGLLPGSDHVKILVD
jgi:hypothetical protein